VPRALLARDPCRNGAALSPEMGVFSPPYPFFKNVKGVRKTEILVEQQPPQGVLVCDHAGLVINTISHAKRGNRHQIAPAEVPNPRTATAGRD